MSKKSSANTVLYWNTVAAAISSAVQIHSPACSRGKKCKVHVLPVVRLRVLLSCFIQMMGTRSFLLLETCIQWKLDLNFKGRKYEVSHNPSTKCESRETSLLEENNHLLKAAGRAINKNEMQSNLLISIFSVIKLDAFFSTVVW